MILKLVLGAVGLFGGAAQLETLLENYVMDKVPAWSKGLVVPVVSAVVTLILSIVGGMPVDQALALAIGGGGLANTLHNMPATTSKEPDFILPPPPVDALGVPGEVEAPTVVR